MTAGIPKSEMRFCGEPTADFDAAGECLRAWYDANCPELHLGGWRGALRRGIRRVLFGYRDYDVDRDRHSLMLGLLNEVERIHAEQARQLAALGAARSRRGGKLVVVNRAEVLGLLDHVDSLVRWCSVSIPSVERYDAGSKAFWAVVHRIGGDDEAADRLAADVPNKVVA